MAERRNRKAWRNIVLGALVVMCGVSAAVVTLLARNAEDWELVRLGAIASLLFAGLIVLVVVPPLARAARAEAARLDLPVQLTAGGLLFVGLYAVVVFAAWNTGNNLLFLVFSVLTSTLFVAWSAGRLSLRDLAVSARFPDHIFAGDAAPVVVTLHNAKRLLASFSIIVEARLREEGASAETHVAARDSRKRTRDLRRVLAYFMYAPRRARIEQRVEQTFDRRGLVVVKGFDLSTRFPFGFFRLRRRLRSRDVEIVVYPKPAEAGDELHLLPIDAGRTEAARRGAGHDLHSLRDYQPRDDVRHIDWKATARQRRLIVREFNAEEDRRVHLVLDTNPGDGDDRDARFERGVSLAATLTAHFLNERAELRLTIGEEAGHSGVGREHLYACLRRLALAAPRETVMDGRGRGEFYSRLAPARAGDAESYVILLTTAPRGTIPTELWRKAHVIHL